MACLFSGTTMVPRKHFSLAVHQNSTKSLLFLTRRDFPSSLSVFLKSPRGYTASVNSSTQSLLLSLRRCRASITHTAIRMRVSGSRIKLWCPLISLALIQFFTPASAQGNCCLHGSELVFALVYWLLCGCLKYEMLS